MQRLKNDLSGDERHTRDGVLTELWIALVCFLDHDIMLLFPGIVQSGFKPRLESAVESLLEPSGRLFLFFKFMSAIITEDSNY